MIQFLFVALLLAILYLAARLFVQMRPGTLVQGARKTVSLILWVLALIALLSGRFALLSIPLALAGVAVWLKRSLKSRGASSSIHSTGTHTSTVRSKFFQMYLDHETGALEGQVIHGQFTGRELSSLDEEELKLLYQEVSNELSLDADSLSLIEAYLDSILPTWRENFHAHAGSGQSASTSAGAVTEEEAYEILGLLPGADEAAIRDAHRRLMLKLHPDRGGTTFLAAKINEAKDVLLRNHSSVS